MSDLSSQSSLLRPLTVVAFGGNALIQARDLGTVGEQIRRADVAAGWLVEVCRQGHDLLIVHGNGPQVGQVLIQMHEGQPIVPAGSLDYAVAETQGSVGYLLDLALRNRLLQEGVEREVATVMSLVVVDSEDPGFENPSKPVGPFFSEYQAEELRADLGWQMIEDAGRGFRKVVASPRPLEMIGVSTVRDLLRQNRIVIAGGGGGVPVVRDEAGGLTGVEAVIDKDRTAALLGLELKATRLLIVTDVAEVYKNFGEKNQSALVAITAAEARSLLAQGQFPAGSMGPKIEAAADFVEFGGGQAIITNTERLDQALAGLAGTNICAGPKRKREFLARRREAEAT